MRVFLLSSGKIININRLREAVNKTHELSGILLFQMCTECAKPMKTALIRYVRLHLLMTSSGRMCDKGKDNFFF